VINGLFLIQSNSVCGLESRFQTALPHGLASLAGTGGLLATA